ncbi:hypothetical protein C8F01DRAFT_1284846 [Mycena amicta]|nr:hypothetical protein C8F01DRAFT_1284846 [Mycena amicta]
MDESDASHMDTFYDILAQAAAPSFERQARSLLVEAEATLARIESQIKVLFCARDRQRARVAALKYAVSPVRMVPSDILTEIFLHVTAAASMPFASPTAAVKAALRLSGVCAYWRQLALCIPRLWNGPMRLNVSNVSAGYAAVTKDILERSSPHPISITLDNGTTSISAALVNIVVSFAHRWSSIMVKFDIFPFLQTAPPQSKTLHQLTSANFNLSRGISGPPSALFLDAPRLSDVFLEIPNLSELPLPWSQLTALYLTHHEPLLLDIIGQFISLRRLYLSTMAWMEDNLPDVSDIVALPQLEDLQLSIWQRTEASTFTPFFAHFALPVLESLHINMDTDHESHLGDAFVPFLRRCLNLEHLSISFCAMDSDALDNILLNIPRAKTFALEDCHNCVDDAFFERLTYRETDLAPVAPCLQTLMVAGVWEEYDENSIQEMIRSRWWSDEAFQSLPSPPRVARWKEIVISANDGESGRCSADFEAMMNELRGQGLSLRVALKDDREY